MALAKFSGACDQKNSQRNQKNQYKKFFHKIISVIFLIE